VPAGLDVLMDAANSRIADPSSGVGTDLRPDQPAPISAPNSKSSRAEVNGGSGPPFLLDRPHPSDLERAVAEAAAHPPLASP
jgi:hypothetical protein